MSAEIYALLSVITVSLISFVGLITLSIGKYFTQKLTVFLVAFSAGAMLGDVFIHLLPELAEKQYLNLETSLYILGAIIFFFILERFIHWHHHHHNGHNGDCE